jgi:hypothetical protein
MFQYTHLIRKYSLRSSSSLIEPGKNDYLEYFYDVHLNSPTHSVYDHNIIGYHGAF